MAQRTGLETLNLQTMSLKSERAAEAKVIIAERGPNLTASTCSGILDTIVMSIAWDSVFVTPFV